MSDEQPPPKICVVCGKDCSTSRRIKDEHGRYYHRECFKKAKREKQARQATHAQKGSGVDLAPNEDIVPYDLDLGEAAEPKTAYADLEQSGEPAKRCPHCHAPMPENAMACSKCGYNIATGKRLPTTYAEMAAARLGDTSGGRIWPAVVGITSIAVGLGGLIYYGLLLAGALGLEDRGPYAIAKIAVAAAGLLLALWAGVSGIGVLRRKQMPMVWLQRWAVLKTLLALAAAAFLAIGLLFLDGFAGRFDADYGSTTADAGIAAILLPGILIVLWVLLWPAFILFWYARESVQKQIGDWR